MSHVARHATKIALLLALASLFPAALASDSNSQPLEIQQVNVQSNLVVVQLHNPGDSARVVTVEVSVVLKGGAVESGASSVFVDRGATASAVVSFSAAVGKVSEVQMGDDSDPF